MYACNKCGSINLRLEEKGSQVGLYCNDCNAWIKWVSKKELNQVKKQIEENANESKDLTFEYERIGKRELYYDIQLQLLNIDDDSTLTNEQKYIQLVQIINNIGDMLSISESISNTMQLFNSSEVLTDIRNYSIKTQQRLINKYGRYERDEQ